MIDPKCPTCHGSGHIIIDALRSRRCDCLKNQLFAAKLGFLYKAKDLKVSPLSKRATENVFVLASDEEINPHLRRVFIGLGLDERWLYIDDSNILQAYLGKPNAARAENLQDFLSYPFMVIRLGTVGYKNVALPGVICELIQLRVLGCLTTWVVSHRKLESETCREYSPELEMLISHNFSKVLLPRYKSSQTANPQRVAMNATRTEVEMGEMLEEGPRPMIESSSAPGKADAQAANRMALRGTRE